jgi:hypothetical protein
VLKNEPYYIARMQQPRIKKLIKKQIGMSKAYCFGDTNKLCRQFVCHTVRNLADGQFADHINIDGCDNIEKPNKKSVKEVLKEYGETWSIPGPNMLKTVMKKWSEETKKFCHKTANTADDRCKNKVECLMIEGIVATWPDLFDTKDCGDAALAQYEVKQDTSPKARAARALAKKKGSSRSSRTFSIIQY